METICVRIKIKKGTIENVREWFQTLRKRPNEVLESLENEGVIIESVFLDSQDEDDYLIYYMKANSLSHAREIASKSFLPIDDYHKKCLKMFCEDRQELEQLLDFHRL